jgi:PAS domain S-box-containing protein
MSNDRLELNEMQKVPHFSVRNLLLTVSPVGLTIILFVCATFFIAIPALEQSLMESRKEMSRELTNAVWSLLQSYNQKVQVGELTLEEAQQQALSQIRVIQYGPDQKDYFWINDMQHRMIMHPYRTDLEGQDQTDLQDDNGMYLVREFVKTVSEKGQGYVEYLWQWQDDSSRIISKCSFVRGFEPWGWIIGTGIYIEDVDQMIDSIISKLRILLAIILVFVLILSTYTVRQARKLEMARFLSMRGWQDVETRYRTLVESMNEGMGIQDENDTIVFVNESFCRILGYSKEELIGKNVYALFDDKNGDILKQQTEQRRQNEQISLYELKLIGKNKKEIHLLVSGHPFYDQSNDFSGTFALIIDITELKEKDLAYRESEEKFRATFEISPSLIMIIRSEDGIFVDVNDTFSRICGLERDEIIGRTAQDLPVWQSTAERDRLLKIVGKGDHLADEATKIVGEDGALLTVLFSTRIIHLNEVPHFVCFGRDVTDRIDADEKYNSILQTMKDGYCETDLNGRFQFFNSAFSDILGYSMNELKNVNYHDHMVKENANKLREVYARILRTGESIEAIEVEYFKKDGTSGYAEFSVALVYNARGEPTGFSSIFRDITPRKKTEQEMEKMGLYLKNTIDMMPSVIVILDAEKKITQWNNEAEIFSGLSFEKARGRFFFDLFPLFNSVESRIDKVLKEQKPYQRDKYQIMGEDGKKTHDILIYPIKSGNLTGAVIRIDDTTARVRMEEIMIQSEKMMSIGELAAGTAHEINNPLGGILIASQNIERRLSLDRKKNHEVAASCGIKMLDILAYLEKQKILKSIVGIRNSGVRAADIVSRMLQFSRISESKMSWVDMVELVERSVLLACNDYDLKKQYDFKSIVIDKQYEGNLPYVPCVEMEIEQVLLNILKNAAQAMAGKRSDGDTSRISLRMARVGEMVEIQIEDNGPGMEEQIRKRVFEPFVTTKPIGEGTGLGLSVSYMIVTNNHKGAIEVVSEPAKGSTFFIRLPLDQPNYLAEN